jgi:hypothetical protein
VKPWCVLVLGRGVSEDFLVSWWRRSNCPHTGLTAPLWTASFRVVSSVVGACVLRLLVVFVPRTSSTLVATRFWQTEGRSAERVISGIRPSEFVLSEFQSPPRRIFIGSHSLPPLWSPNWSFTTLLQDPALTVTNGSWAAPSDKGLKQRSTKRPCTPRSSLHGY